MKEKKIYTREQKIEFYTKQLVRAQRRLRELTSEQYQDFDSELQKQLDSWKSLLIDKRTGA